MGRIAAVARSPTRGRGPLRLGQVIFFEVPDRAVFVLVQTASGVNKIQACCIATLILLTNMIGPSAFAFHLIR